jgi:hypothetical protein
MPAVVPSSAFPVSQHGCDYNHNDTGANKHVYLFLLQINASGIKLVNKQAHNGGAFFGSFFPATGKKEPPGRRINRLINNTTSIPGSF